MIEPYFYSNVNHHWSLRSSVIDTITIHCAVGLANSNSIARYLDTMTDDSSANYCIGKDGDITCMIPEKYRSWCSSNTANDDRAITIEVASETSSPYKVPTLAMASLIDLLVDICSRHDMRLKWSWDANERRNHVGGCNMTVHRDFAAKSCPGDYLFDNMIAIAQTVNRRLSSMENARFMYLDDIPVGYRDFISNLVDVGVVKGKKDGSLDLSIDMIRCLVFCERMIDDFYDRIIEYYDNNKEN